MPDIALLSSRPEIVTLLRETFGPEEVSMEVSAATRVIVRDDDSRLDAIGRPDSSCVLWISDAFAAVNDEDVVVVSTASFTVGPASCIAFCRKLALAKEKLLSMSRDLEAARHVEQLMSSPDLAVVFEKVTRTALTLAGRECATLLLHDPVAERYVVAWGNDPNHADTGEFLSGVPPALLQEALDREERVAIRWNGGRGAMAILPIQVGSDLIGVLKIALPRGVPHDEVGIRAAASYIGSVTPVLFSLHQLSKNKDLAMRDDLTKAFNRRFFEAYLDEELERARRYNSQLSVIFLDLDDLKLVNNLYGHLTGSRMLQEVAKRILTAVRTIDKVVRFGGDEFCVILPQTDPLQARSVASRVRAAMTERPFYLDPGIEVPITASFGIAAYPIHAMTKEDLIRAADAAMYSVKSTTKNAIAIAANDMPKSPRLSTHAE